MKATHLFLSLASLSLAAVCARAADAELSTTTEIVHLPVFEVVAPRQSPMERDIAKSLGAFCAAVLDREPTPVAAELQLKPAAVAENRNEAAPAPIRLAKS